MFNTELARSTGERIEIPFQIRRQLDRLAIEIAALRKRLEKDDELTVTEKEEFEETLADREARQNKKWDQLGRSVDVYGAINLRTDGRSAVVAFRNEQPKGYKRWFVYRLEKDTNGAFQVQEKGGH